MKKVAFTAFITLIIGIIGFFTVSGNVFSVGRNASIDERETVTSRNIDSMIIKVDVGEVNIKESKNDEIDVHLHGSIAKKLKDQMEFSVEENGSTVEVKVSQRENTFFLQFPFINADFNSKRVLDVSVPKELLNKLDVKTDVGEIAINGIDVDELKAHSDVGEIYVNGFTGLGDFQSNVGEVELENISGKIKAHTDTGEIDIKVEEMTDDIELSSDVGEVTVRFAKEPSNIGFDLSSDIGEVSINGFKGYDNNSSGSIITQIGNGGPMLKVSTDIGEILVEN
ncbi:hypothetical protein JOC75_003221 [Metabacillus crassostreae]|uniref:DUF4097 family beta strand repeat-containing protein n=1 Tax=Metabacillus crassostreae TaxID=929098 RepID=UPI001957B232|nr:DUF4097 family beta strand repeat-containing protein [Metabacillus crassostreae]MBM7605198.1 hypothetical protein [Metabacillus crassostreae]